jgi:hypothetical protein
LAFSENGAWPGNYPRHTATTQGVTRRVYSILQPEHGTIPIIYTNIKINTMYDINLKAEVTATIDELNQYLLGNVTNQAAIEAPARSDTSRVSAIWITTWPTWLSVKLQPK